MLVLSFLCKEHVMYKHKCSDIDVLGLRLCYYPGSLGVSFAGTNLCVHWSGLLSESSV
jgi:hypothetical protein